MGNGSQTVLPPSQHPSRSLYAWEPGHSPDDLPIAPAPAWLVERLRAETQPTPHAAPSGGGSLDDDYAREANALRAIPNNDAPYDDWLTVGMALHSTGASWARELWDDWSRQSAQYNEGKQEKSWRSFTQDGKTTIGTLFHRAKQYGWHPLQPTFTVNGSRLVPDMTQTATTDANHRQNGHSAHPALITRCAADVTPEQVQWLWKPYIALGTICMLDGDPGIGKSLLTLQLAANVSEGYPFPDQAGKPTVNAGEPQNVLIMTREDSLSKTIRPRLDASGADVSRVFVSANWLDAEGKEQAFTLKHLPLLEAELERLRPRLVVLDPIQSFFGDIDMHRANQTRPLLDALGALADKYRCAILCIRHPAKPGEGIGKALHRGLGSIDIIGAARTGLFIEQYPGDETRALMAQTKSNLGSKGRTQIFSKKEGVFAWERVTRLTDEDLAGSGRGPNHRTFLEALLWLEQRLEGGLAWNASDIEKEAEERDISSNILKRAKKALGIVSVQLKGDAHLGWTWRLPPLSIPPTESSKVTESPDQKSKTYGGEKVCAPEERLSDSEGSEGSEDSEDGVVKDGISASEAPTSDRLSGGGESCPQCHCTSLLVLGEYRKCPLCLWKGKLSVSGQEEVIV